MSADPTDPDTRKRSVASIFDGSAATYDRVGVDFFTPMGRDLVTLAAVSEGAHVLDLGCGRGAVLFAAVDAAGPTGQVTGLDLSPAMVELTAAEVRSRGLATARVHVGDAERPDVPDLADHSVDAVLAGLSLFFLPDPTAALRRYHRLLRPSGRLGFTTYAQNDRHFEAGMRAAADFVPGGMPNRDERQGAFGSVEGIAGLLAANGFAVTHTEDRAYRSRFTDPDHMLAWTWSHGGRAVLGRIPDTGLPKAAEAMKTAFADARTPAGDYAITTRIRFTIAAPLAQ